MGSVLWLVIANGCCKQLHGKLRGVMWVLETINRAKKQCVTIKNKEVYRAKNQCVTIENKEVLNKKQCATIVNKEVLERRACFTA